eukprot:1267767-Amorphochlora_amoeboformis.AAC.1
MAINSQNENNKTAAVEEGETEERVFIKLNPNPNPNLKPNPNPNPKPNPKPNPNGGSKGGQYTQLGRLDM